MKCRKILATGVILIAFGVDISAAPLFEDSARLEIELVGPIKELTADRNGKQEMQFTLRTQGIDHEINVRLRGNSRRRVCEFPPLRLNFKTNATAETVFENQNKLKLVTHCRERDAAEQDLLKEYMAYRIFNMLSEKSYRVRLVSINYVDTDPTRAGKTLKRYGYFIESSNELAERIAATRVTRTGVSLGSLDSRQASLVYVFQYLIGNTDWSLVRADTEEFCCHNTDLFGTASEFALIPYDFDLSGLVDSSYAKPDPELRIRIVRQRAYRGYCLPADHLTSALQLIAGKQYEITELPMDIPGLIPKEKEITSRYLGEYFKSAKDIEKIVRKFDSRCL